jgi:hypothetical protein
MSAGLVLLILLLSLKFQVGNLFQQRPCVQQDLEMCFKICQMPWFVIHVAMDSFPLAAHHYLVRPVGQGNFPFLVQVHALRADRAHTRLVVPVVSCVHWGASVQCHGLRLLARVKSARLDLTPTKRDLQSAGRVLMALYNQSLVQIMRVIVLHALPVRLLLRA